MHETQYMINTVKVALKFSSILVCCHQLKSHITCEVVKTLKKVQSICGIKNTSMKALNIEEINIKIKHKAMVIYVLCRRK